MRMQSVFGRLPPNCLLQYPSGRWGFAGSVDSRLSFTAPDGSPADPEVVQKAIRFGPGMFLKAGKLVSCAWDTAEEAVAAADALGLQVTR